MSFHFRGIKRNGFCHFILLCLTFLLKYSWFTMLCWFQEYSRLVQYIFFLSSSYLFKLVAHYYRYHKHFTGLPWWLRWWKNLPAMRETWVWSWVGKIPWRREWLPTPICLLETSMDRQSLSGYRPWGCKSVRHGWATNITDITNALQTLPNQVTCEGNIFETR